MKTILVPVDFSATTQHAGQYALYMANAMKANLILCHALDTASPSQKEAIIEALQHQADSLRKQSLADGLNIEYIVAPGSVTNVVVELVKNSAIDLVVMGLSGGNAVNRMLLGSKSEDLINKAHFPVLLMPFKGLAGPINKIAFASDLSEGDVGLIHSLAGFARQFNAEILVVHVSGEKADQHKIDLFLNEVTCKVNYPKIYYRHIKNEDIDRGLSWIAKNGWIDVFAMVHRSKTFSEKLFSGSHTHQLSRNTGIPLLVFPEQICPVF